MSNYEFEFEGASSPALREELTTLAGREPDQVLRATSKRGTRYLWLDEDKDLFKAFEPMRPSEFEARHKVKWMGIYSVGDPREMMKSRADELIRLRAKSDSELWWMLEKAEVAAVADVLVERARR
jgi:hypothetical protein